jgi:hypothetical protein
MSLRNLLATVWRPSAELAQCCARVLPEAPNEGPHRLALGDGLPRVEPMTVSTVPFAARCSATFSAAVEAAALLAFRRGFLTGRPRPRSGQATRRPAQRQLPDARAILTRALEGFSPTAEMPEIAEAQALLERTENGVKEGSSNGKRG